MKEMLFDKYWSNFWIWLTISVTIIIVFIILIVFRNKLLLDKTSISNTRFVRIMVFTIVGIFILFSLTKLTLLCMDLELVNSNDCEIFEGEFINYTKYEESNRPGYPRGKNPLFMDEDSRDEITLTGTQEYEIGEIYTIYYLPSSMIYIIVKTNQSN